MVFLTEVKGELEEEVEMMDIISKEGNVVGLTNSSNMDGANNDTKARVLSTLDLFIVLRNVKFSTRFSALLKT